MNIGKQIFAGIAFVSVAVCSAVQAQPVQNPVSTPNAITEPSDDTVVSPTPAAPPRSTQSTSSAAAADDPPPYVPAAVIGVNNTSATNDDCVELTKSLPCLIRLSNPNGTDVAVTLNNTDDRINFVGEDASGYLSLTLPGDGSTVAFTVTGVNDSENMNDAVIHVHAGSVFTPIIGTQPMTVYTYNQAKLTTQTGDNYSLVFSVVAGTISYTTNAAAATNMYASFHVKPDGVPTDIPQTQNTKVGFAQTAVSNKVTMNQSKPVAQFWNPSVAHGTVFKVPALKIFSAHLNYPCRDSGIGLDPLYDKPGQPNTLSSTSVTYPLGTSTGLTAFTIDTPSFNSTIPDRYVMDPANPAVPLCIYRYTAYRVFRVGEFHTFCVRYESDINVATLLRQRKWTLNLDTSNAATNQHSNNTFADTVPTEALYTQGYYANANTVEDPEVDSTTAGSSNLTAP